MRAGWCSLIIRAKSIPHGKNAVHNSPGEHGKVRELYIPTPCPEGWQRRDTYTANPRAALSTRCGYHNVPRPQGPTLTNWSGEQDGSRARRTNTPLVPLVVSWTKGTKVCCPGTVGCWAGSSGPGDFYLLIWEWPLAAPMPAAHTF